MKIVMLFDGLQVGGIEKVGSDYAKLLCRLGHEVSVINLNPALDDMEKEFPKESSIYHIKFGRLLAPEIYSSLAKSRWWGRFAYPIIFVIVTILNYLYRPFVKLTNKCTREKYDVAIAFAGHFNDLTFITNNFVKADKTLCWLHGSLSGYILMSEGYLRLYRKIKNLVVLSEDSQIQALSHNSKISLNITNMFNPTFIKDTTIDKSKVDKLKNEFGKYILMVSRFEYPHKDHYTVVDAFEILREKYGSDLQLVFVGEGKDEKAVKEYVNRLNSNVRECIHFEGNRMDPQNYYAAAYMLVHASIAGEGLPTVMIEAMEYSVPMVVTDVKVGPREILEDNKYGLLCKVQNPADMADKIYKLYSDNELYLEYQKMEKERIKVFRPETIMKQLEEILVNLK